MFHIYNVKFYIIIILFVISCNASLFEDQFEEELLIKPLQNGYVYSQFQFTTVWNVSSEQQLHYRLFPRALGEILQKYNVKELHLSLTQGQWKHKLWGYPVHDSPAGVQLWVWFDEAVSNVDEKWFGLSNALSGLFCASLNFIDGSNTVSPHLSFRPFGSSPDKSFVNSSLLRYASLPREIVCTENLTPWKKLLPCGLTSGLAALLNARQLYDSSYHSLGVHFLRECKQSSCEHLSWNLVESLSSVYETPSSSQGKQEWSFKKIFASAIVGHCPLARTSLVHVDLSTNITGNYFDISPPPSKWLTNGRNVPLALYNIKDLVISNTKPFNLIGTYREHLYYKLSPTPVLHANRYIKGSGRGSGIIQSQILYSKMSSPLKIIYMEEIPHYARVFAHTLKIISNNVPLLPDYLYISDRKSNEEAFLMEAVITLPPNSLTTISLEFERSFLKFGAYPPDANHGFYIGSAVISTFIETARNLTSTPNYFTGIHPELHSLSKSYLLRLHTEILLLVLPTPDFSMPYNVICLVCTVVALAFGPLHSITTKKLVVVNAKEDGKLLSKIKKLIPFKREKKD